VSEPAGVEAGEFSAWIQEIAAALRGERSSDVPCGSCTGCCTSSQFVHIRSDETETLAHIPAALVFPAPGRPQGDVVLGYDDRGRCPMLGESGCSIYEYRPQTCRVYDCRVFAAVDAVPEGHDKAAIAARAGVWRFAYEGAEARARQEAVLAAARYIDVHRDALPAWLVPINATQRAVLAVEIHDIFVRAEGQPSADAAAVGADILRRFGGGSAGR